MSAWTDDLQDRWDRVMLFARETDDQSWRNIHVIWDQRDLERRSANLGFPVTDTMADLPLDLTGVPDNRHDDLTTMHAGFRKLMAAGE